MSGGIPFYFFMRGCMAFSGDCIFYFVFFFLMCYSHDSGF